MKKTYKVIISALLLLMTVPIDVSAQTSEYTMNVKEPEIAVNITDSVNNFDFGPDSFNFKPQNKVQLENTGNVEIKVYAQVEEVSPELTYISQYTKDTSLGANEFNISQLSSSTSNVMPLKLDSGLYLDYVPIGDSKEITLQFAIGKTTPQGTYYSKVKWTAESYY